MIFRMKTLRILSLTIFLFAICASCFAERPDISADSQRFDLMTMRYILDGNVTVTMKDRVITADHAEVSVASMEVWAKGHIRLVEGDINFTGDDLYVKGSGHEAVVTGNAFFERGDFSVKSERASFSWDTKLAEFSGKVTMTEAKRKKRLKRLVYNVITGEITDEER